MSESTNEAKSTGAESGAAAGQGNAAKPGKAAKTWDIPTRVFHWLLAACSSSPRSTPERGIRCRISLSTAPSGW